MANLEQPGPEQEALRALLPADRLGVVRAVQPIRGGLSGARVYAVSTARGEYVLRIQAERADEALWAEQLLVLRRAADNGVAPLIVHVDKAAGAIVSARIPGVPLGAALNDPTQRHAFLTSVVDRLRVLHGLDRSAVTERNPVTYARDIARVQRARPGFPSWAAGLDATLASAAGVLANDAGRVVSHNDLNPSNLIWDGERTWLVDWDVAGLGHPHYDLATLAMFLNLSRETTLGLIALHDEESPDETTLVNFAALRRLSALLCGVMFLSLVPDLNIAPANPSTLVECYGEMRGGTLDLQTTRGRAKFGLALLQVGVDQA
jgi:thiamine kinase-like enzyme